MELLKIKDLYRSSEQYLNQTVEICGWVRSIRSSKSFGFIVVNDGTFFEPLQIVYTDKLDNFAEIEKQSSLSRYRQRRSVSRVPPLRIIRCRRSVTALNI